MADETRQYYDLPWEEAVKKAQLLVADMAFCKNCGATSKVALTPQVVKKLYDEYVRLGVIDLGDSVEPKKGKGPDVDV